MTNRLPRGTAVGAEGKRGSFMAVTIRDVAKRAGVSISTVSAVINGTKYVSPKLRRRVEEAIEELGYIPSLIGRALSSQRSSMVAYIIPTISNPFFSSMIKTVEQNVFASGLGLLVCPTEEEEEKARRYEAFLVGAHVDGVLISPLSSRPLEEQCRPFLDRDIPVVVLAGSRTTPHVDAVVLDDASGMRRLTQYLVQLGHRRVAFFGRKRSVTSAGRLAAVREVLADAGLELRDDWVVEAPRHARYLPSHETYRQAKALLGREDRPTAVLCHNDAVAVGVLQACYDLGLRVPDDVSVTGFDDTLASVTSPPLTTLRVPIEDMAERATGILLDRIAQEKEQYRHAERIVHWFEPELVVRASTGAPEGTSR